MAPLRSGERRSQCGATAVELTVALLVVLMLGLGVFQFVLIYQARLAIDQAVVEAGRSGSTGHGTDEAIRRGLARGLAPLWFGAEDAADLQASEAKALVRIVTGEAEGAIRLRRVSPGAAAFEDWEEPALDPMGEPIAGETEIPNDNLDVRRTRTVPRAGVAGHRGVEPIGAQSGLTLVDANLLRLELVYGVRLAVPVAGRMIATTLSAWLGCGAGAGGGGGPGADDDGGADGAGGIATSDVDFCPHLQASPPRLPLRAVATIRMMSPMRRSAIAGGSVGGPAADGGNGGNGGGAGQGGGGSAAPGTGGPTVAVGEGSDPGPAPGGSADGQAGTAAGRGGGQPSRGTGSATGQSGLGNGFLGIGSDREYPHPAVCAEG